MGNTNSAYSPRQGPGEQRQIVRHREGRAEQYIALRFRYANQQSPSLFTPLDGSGPRMQVVIPISSLRSNPYLSARAIDLASRHRAISSMLFIWPEVTVFLIYVYWLSHMSIPAGYTAKLQSILFAIKYGHREFGVYAISTFLRGAVEQQPGYDLHRHLNVYTTLPMSHWGSGGVGSYDSNASSRKYIIEAMAKHATDEWKKWIWRHHDQVSKTFPADLLGLFKAEGRRNGYRFNEPNENAEDEEDEDYQRALEQSLREARRNKLQPAGRVCELPGSLDVERELNTALSDQGDTEDPVNCANAFNFLDPEDLESNIDLTLGAEASLDRLSEDKEINLGARNTKDTSVGAGISPDCPVVDAAAGKKSEEKQVHFAAEDGKGGTDTEGLEKYVEPDGAEIGLDQSVKDAGKDSEEKEFRPVAKKGKGGAGKRRN